MHHALFVLQMTDRDLQTLLDGLRELPYKRSAELIRQIQQTVAAQHLEQLKTVQAPPQQVTPTPEKPA